MRFIFSLAALAVSSLVAAGGCVAECSSQNDCLDSEWCTEGRCEPVPDPCAEGFGNITGYVRTPDNSTAVIGATVVLDGGATATSGADGSFRFEGVGKGDHTLTAERGVFEGTEIVSVCGGRDVVARVEVKPPPGTMAVVPGDFDSIEAVLDRIGLVEGEHYDLLQASALKDIVALAPYRKLFLNCTSTTVASDPEVQVTLDAWVRNGGSVYASDWAFEYVAETWPTLATFLEEPRYGEAGHLDGEVLDAEISLYLDKTGVELDYNLGGWVAIEGASPGTRILVRSAVEGLGVPVGRPLMFQADVGEGRVTYTTFHNEAQTTGDMDRILTYLAFAL